MRPSAVRGEPVVWAVLGGVVDNSSNEKTDGDRPLVSTNDGTTNPLGCGLRLVQRDESGDHADSVSSKETTSDENGDVGGDSLQDDADAENDHGDHETIATTKEVTARCGCESAEECASRLCGR